MKNTLIAIHENTTLTRYYVAIDSDIATGKCYAYNPEVGYKVITPYKDCNAFETARIRKNPYPWMVEFDPSIAEVPENWMN